MSYETQSFIWCYSVLLLRSLNPRPTEKWPCCGLLPVSPCAVIPLLGKGSSLTISIPSDTQAGEQQVHSQCEMQLNPSKLVPQSMLLKVQSVDLHTMKKPQLLSKWNGGQIQVGQEEPVLHISPLSSPCPQLHQHKKNGQSWQL